MTRVINILFLLSILAMPTWSQITSITGEIRYQHQFQDAISGKSYSKLIRKNPQLTLGTSGYIYAQSILSFNLQSALNVYYNTLSVGGITSSYKQSLFNFYNFGINILQNSKVQFSFNARDLEVQSSSNQRFAMQGLSNLRQQEQRLTIAASGINFLPTTIFYYSRVHNFSETGLSHINQRQDEFSLNLSQSTQNGIYNMIGMINQNTDNTTGRRYTYSRVQFNGSKELSASHRVDVNSEYSKYESVAFLSGNGIYNGSIGQDFRLNTTLNGRNTTSLFVSSTLIGIAQTVQFLPSENYHYMGSFQNQYSNDIYSTDSTNKKVLGNHWNASASFQHMRQLGQFVLTNDLSVGYGQQRSELNQNSSTVGLNNSLQTTISIFQIIGNHGLTYTRILGYLPRDEVNNFINTSITGMLFNKVASQTGFDYRSERRLRTTNYRYHRQTLSAHELLSTSQYYYIPFTISIGTTFNWMWQDIRGYTYGINISISSSNFFINGLSMNYRFNRMYDIYYKKPNQEHLIELGYQWRSLMFQVRLQEFRFVDVRHDLWFIVTRPINIGL